MNVLFTALLILLSNLFLYGQINTLILRMNSVYSSNVDLTELSDCLEEVRQDLYRYLETRDYETLSDYYRASSDYQSMIEQFPEKVSNNPVQVRQKNIRSMSEKFLRCTDDAVMAKRGMNVERYRDLYSEAMRLYGFIGNDIALLNEQQFQNNAQSYTALQGALQYLEVTSILVLIVVIAISTWIMGQLTGRMVAPLKRLAHTAELVGAGDFGQKVEETGSADEVGVVTRTFNQMVDSINTYVIQIREAAERQQELMERELMMQNHLKEAQLRFLQAQINPHFLFNSLNAGVQLAEMEDDEKTAVFLSRMAEFFRYNVKKGTEDAAVREELETVENYIYILNVRFAGEIGFEVQADRRAENFRMPSMILQPIVENAVNHGIRDMEGGGKIVLTIEYLTELDRIRIRVADNGRGMTKEQIRAILGREEAPHEDEGAGIGMDNVISRLCLYYQTDRDSLLPEKGGEGRLITIESDGPGTGTEVTLNLPASFGQKKTEEVCIES